MVPGRVGREYFLTRGHIHARANRPEIYVGEAGAGVMLMESPAGEIRTMAISPRTICYVPPFWIHRSVNVGTTALVMSFAYPADAGQDYGIIARSGGMRRRVVDDGAGGWTLADNPAWQPRDEAELARILAA
jgi:glucose-6-phosphate isomerase